MPYCYLTLAAAVVITAAAVISATAARGERAVKTAHYAVCSAGKALCETSYDTVAAAVVAATVIRTTVIRTTVVYIAVVSAAAVVIVVYLTASAATA